jgi:hypothetical protein
MSTWSNSRVLNYFALLPRRLAARHLLSTSETLPYSRRHVPRRMKAILHDILAHNVVLNALAPRDTITILCTVFLVCFGTLLLTWSDVTWTPEMHTAQHARSPQNTV